MRLIFVCIFIHYFAPSLFGQNFELGWATTIGSVGAQQTSGCAVTPAGDVVSVGNFLGIIDLDPGLGEELVDGGDDQTVYIQKLDAEGNFLWAKSFGGSFPYGPKVHSIKVGQNGDLYITGTFRFETDVDPGPGEFTLSSLSSQSHTFVLKLDSDGNFEWAQHLGRGSDSNRTELTVTPDGNVYFIGNFTETIDFDGGFEEFFMTPEGASDIYILKLNADGEFLWAKSIPAGNSISCISDLAENLYVTGLFADTVDFDPGPSVYNENGNDNNVFVLKLDENGDFIFVKSVGSENYLSSAGFDQDNFGNLYVGLLFDGEFDVDPGIDASNLSALGSTDFCVLKLNEAGEFVWAKQIGSVDQELCTDIALDQHNQVHVLGDYNYSVDFDPGPGVSMLTSTAGKDIFLMTLNAEGAYINAYSIGGGSDDDYGSRCVVDAIGNIYFTGAHKGNTDFDPSPALLELNSVETTWNVFVVKFNALGLGIETSLVEKISVYPNPFSETVTVYFGEELKNFSVQIVDLLGNQVYTDGQVNGSQLLIEAGYLTQGMYILLLVDNDSGEVMSNAKLMVK